MVSYNMKVVPIVPDLTVLDQYDGEAAFMFHLEMAKAYAEEVGIAFYALYVDDVESEIHTFSCYIDDDLADKIVDSIDEDWLDES